MNREFLLDNISELRRTAFVDALNQLTTANNLIGTFGESFYEDIEKEAFIRALGYVPIPILGIDAYVFIYADENTDYVFYKDNSNGEFLVPYCQPIKSTIIYKESEKCPLIYSSKFILHDQTCPYMVSALEKSNLREKNIKKIYDFEEFKKNNKKDIDQKFFKDLIFVLEEIKNLENLIKLKNISGDILSQAIYFSRYIIDLKKRKDFFLSLLDFCNNLTDLDEDDAKHPTFTRKKYLVRCPRGIILDTAKVIMENNNFFNDICSDDKNNFFELETFNDKKQKSHFAPTGCRFDSINYINYKGEETNVR